MKFVLILTTCCLALVLTVRAEEEKKKTEEKKPVQQVQHPPKAQVTKAHTVTKTPQVHTLHTTTLHNANTNLSKAPFRATTQGQTKVQTFHAQHFNLANKPNPNIPNVKFTANNHIQGAQNWKGPKYAAFKNYHAQWHDQGWWHSHFGSHIVLIGGGYYYWNGGYWYPAWGYDPAYAYYAYDGPIYAGNADMDPGQVVANVQSALQAQGYYNGEVDGLLGPQTRAALAEYQQAQGLEPTSAIDEPTLESLGMA